MIFEVSEETGFLNHPNLQALIVIKILNPSKLPYLDHYELVEIKNVALDIIIFEIPLIQV